MKNGQVSEHGKLLELMASLNSTLVQHDNSFGLVDCVVSQIKHEFHLAQLSFDGVKISLPASNLKIGQQVRLQVLAKDISICLEPPKNTSILNILAVTIVAIKSDENMQCLISLKVGRFYLTARISEYSRQMLKLEVAIKPRA